MLAVGVPGVLAGEGAPDDREDHIEERQAQHGERHRDRQEGGGETAPVGRTWVDVAAQGDRRRREQQSEQQGARVTPEQAGGGGGVGGGTQGGPPGGPAAEGGG